MTQPPITDADPPRPLGDRIPATPGDMDEILEAFLAWVSDRGVSLYEAQEEAILELMAGRHVILATPTGSGKSLVALAMHFLALCTGKRAYYTSPIKALASEKFFDLCQTLGPDNVGMLTGDASVNRDAPVICCTAEILANIALREGADAPVDFVVMDEFHYYSDRDRGMAWQIPLLTLERARFLLMSATLGDTSAIATALEARTDREVAVVSSSERPVPLRFTYSEDPLHETVRTLVDGNKAPIYQVNFTQRACGEQAQALTSVELCSKEEKRAITAAMVGVRFSSPYGKTIQRFLRHGVGLHHAGLLPRYRRLVEQLAQQGLLKVICGTDTLGVGVNVPIRTVLFTQLCKYDGVKVDVLSVRDFHQIAGRAGRAGFDDVGHVVCQAPAHVIENRRLAAKAAASGGRGKKFVRKKPPERGYKHWDEATFAHLRTSAAEALSSTFRVDHGLLLAFMQREPDGQDRSGGYRDLMTLISRCHDHKGKRSRHRRQCRTLFSDLQRAGILQLESDPSGRRRRVRTADTLQADFSLHHSLSLFLVDALARLDSNHEDHPLQVLSLVESILENPRAILMRQLQRDKGALIAEMKAEGVPYEERMERIEGLTWPKPMAEWIYDVLDQFSQEHPWVGTENVRPKGIAREMSVICWSFDDYVRDLGLEAIEGVLLRYLGSVYRALRQNVPDDLKTDGVRDVEAYLRTTVTQTDASIVGEWERMSQAVEGGQTQASTPAPPLDISADPRAFAARLRAELHALVRALSRGNWDGAVTAVGTPSDTPWTAEDFQQTLAPFVATHGAVVFNHAARLSDQTVVQKVAPHQWEVSQNLLGPEGETNWAIHAHVDLRADTNPAGPMIVIDRIDG